MPSCLPQGMRVLTRQCTCPIQHSIFLAFWKQCLVTYLSWCTWDWALCGKGKLIFLPCWRGALYLEVTNSIPSWTTWWCRSKVLHPAWSRRVPFHSLAEQIQIHSFSSSLSAGNSQARPGSSLFKNSGRGLDFKIQHESCLNSLWQQFSWLIYSTEVSKEKDLKRFLIYSPLLRTLKTMIILLS